MSKNNKIEQVQLKRSLKSFSELDSQGIKLKFGEPTYLPNEGILVIGGEDEDNLISKELRIKAFDPTKVNINNQLFYAIDSDTGYIYVINEEGQVLSISANNIFSPYNGKSVEERLNDLLKVTGHIYFQETEPDLSEVEQGSLWINYTTSPYISIAKEVGGSLKWLYFIDEVVKKADENTYGIVKLGSEGGAARYNHTHNYAGSDTAGGAANALKSTAATSGNYYLLGVGNTNINQVYKASPNNNATYKTGVYFKAETGVLMGAAWNDIAEFVIGTGNPGQCVVPDKYGKLSISKKRLSKLPYVVSDTYGFAIGETKQATLPVAISGKVLAYPDKTNLKVGDVVCAGKDGKVSKMNKLEIILFPDRILGKVAEIPTYSKWNDIDINNRIWVSI